MYVFWDNSNIHYAGLNHVFPWKEPGIDKKRYRTYFSGLLELVLQGHSKIFILLEVFLLVEMHFGMWLKKN